MLLSTRSGPAKLAGPTFWQQNGLRGRLQHQCFQFTTKAKRPTNKRVTLPLSLSSTVKTSTTTAPMAKSSWAARRSIATQNRTKTAEQGLVIYSDSSQSLRLKLLTCLGGINAVFLVASIDMLSVSPTGGGWLHYAPPVMSAVCLVFVPFLLRSITRRIVCELKLFPNGRLQATHYNMLGRKGRTREFTLDNVDSAQYQRDFFRVHLNNQSKPLILTMDSKSSYLANKARWDKLWENKLKPSTL
ncbi:hypothetical protein QOT17_014889 [Balamuthia mandrillaris]